MKAAQFNKYGDSTVIEINNEAIAPAPGKSQILVKVAASGINPVESAIRNGYMQKMLPLSFPATVGGDFSGVISEVGEDVTDFKPGDEVYGLANQFKGGSGAVAELVTASQSNSGLKPSSIDHTQAASLPLVGTSALQAIEEHIQIKDGQKILIQGGAGGVGSIAVQIAKMHGAYVAVTAGSKDLEYVKSLGADEVIDYQSQDFTTIIKDYDAVFDTAGGETTNKSISVLKKGGILVSMSGQAADELVQKQEITALTQTTKGDTAQLARLKELIDSGKVKPTVDKVFPLDEAREAYEYLEKNHPKGKIVIEIK